MPEYPRTPFKRVSDIISPRVDGDSLDIPTGRGATLTVAANDSSALSKQQADYVCDGVDDGEEILVAVNNSLDVYLMEGTYNTAGDLVLAKQHLHIRGAGDGTILNTAGYILLDEEYITIDNCKITGAKGLFVTHSHCKVHNMLADTIQSYVFVIYATNKTIEDVEFINCKSINSYGMGFMLNGEGVTKAVNNARFINCQAINSGRYNRLNEWITGFDLGELVDSVKDIFVSDCLATGSWESGFHIEDSVTKTDVILVNCNSHDNAQKPSPTYGYGFMLGDNMTAVNCKASNNKINFYTKGMPQQIGCSSDNTPVDYTPTQSDNIGNLVPNGDFTQDLNHWFTGMGETNKIFNETSVVLATVSDGATGIHVAKNTSGVTSFAKCVSQCIRIKPDAQYFFDLHARIIQTGTVGVCYSWICFRDANYTRIDSKTYLGMVSIVPPSTWTQYGGYFGNGFPTLIPNGAVYVEIGVWLAYAEGPTIDRIFEVQGIRLMEQRIFRTSDIFMDVLAVSTTHVRSNEDLSAATPITFTLTTQPDVPRTLSWSFDTHAQITEYDMEVIGIDAKGNTVTETWDETAGWSGETSNAFATITSIKMTSRTGTGAGDTMDIGITDVLGLSNIIYGTSDVFKIKKNNANATVATAQVNTTYDTYDMSVITLGAGDDFTIWYKSNLNIIS